MRSLVCIPLRLIGRHRACPGGAERVFENSRWAGVCLAENRRSRLLVGSVITKSPPRPGAHNAIIAISPCPSCPPHAAGGHGRAVYSSSVTDAEWAILEPLLPAPGSTAGRGTPREALPPCDSGRHPVYRARWYRVAATAGGVPAGRDGVRGLRPRPAAGGGSASWTRCATDCGCGPGGTGARPRRSSTRRRYPPPTPCPDPAAAGMAARERTASSDTSPWM